MSRPGSNDDNFYVLLTVDDSKLLKRRCFLRKSLSIELRFLGTCRPTLVEVTYAIFSIDDGNPRDGSPWPGGKVRVAVESHKTS